MNQYKDTTPPAKPQHGATSGQHERKKRLKDKIEVAIGMTFLFCFLLSVTTCQPVRASNQAGTKTAPFPEKSAKNNIAMFQEAGNKNNLLLGAGMGQNKDLSKIHASGKPYRYILAFFVPEFWLASQASQDKDTTHLTHFTGLNRLIYSRPQLEDVTSYGGVTLQNSPFWVICRAVACVTESEPRHPMTFHSVVNTQNKTQGGHYHA